MNNPISLQTLIESIEALSLEDQASLFEQLYKRRIEKQLQENTQKTAKITEALPANNTSKNPLLMVPATIKNNPLFDEVLGYMESYRRQDHELDAEAQAR